MLPTDISCVVHRVNIRARETFLKTMQGNFIWSLLCSGSIVYVTVLFIFLPLQAALV